MEDDRIKSTSRNCRVTPFDIPHELKTKEVEISSSTQNDSNIQMADACSKELDDVRMIVLSYFSSLKKLAFVEFFIFPSFVIIYFLQLCDILRKKHDEAKELLAQAILNNNKLLMLNNPQFEEKISFKLSTFIDFVRSIFIIHANKHCVGLY